jgi:hypothetical protein
MATFNVTSLADSGAGSLREAISIANNTAGADEINFDSALSGGTINLTSGELDISDGLSINGLGSNLLTIDAGGLSRVFVNNNYLSGSSSSISGLKITGGYTTYNADNNGFFYGYGGGILNWGSLNISDSIISNNLGDAGAGIFNFDGTLNIFNTTISDNSLVRSGIGIGIVNQGNLNIYESTISNNSTNGLSSQGGGIFNYNSLRIFDSTISNNSADFGGGISNSGQINITNTNISDNSATNSGGGVYNEYTGQINTINTNISDNSATNSGGGMYNTGSVNLYKSSISNNLSNDKGGGIFNEGSATFYESTISGNSASNQGGGSYLIYYAQQDLFGDSTISGNFAPEGRDIFLLPRPEPIPEGDTILGGILAVALIGFTYFRKRQRHKTVQKLQKKGVLTTPQV